jgi:hypothetical protein
MNRSTLFSFHSLAIAAGALLLMLALGGCGTVMHQLPAP